MTTIGGFVDGILDGTIPPERQNHYLHIVSSEVQRLSRLVRNMLTLSQIEAGERTIQPTEVEITSLVTNTLLGFEQRLEEKHIEVEGLDTDRYWVLADADLIQQVVYNLIDNAVKFVNEGGKALLRLLYRGREYHGSGTQYRLRRPAGGDPTALRPVLQDRPQPQPR